MDDTTTVALPQHVPQSLRTDIDYIVLSSDNGESWDVEKRLMAKTSDAAIEAVIGTNDPGDTEYVAVATRYWSPQTFDVQVETTRKLVAKVKS